MLNCAFHRQDERSTYRALRHVEVEHSGSAEQGDAVAILLERLKQRPMLGAIAAGATLVLLAAVVLPSITGLPASSRPRAETHGTSSTKTTNTAGGELSSGLADNAQALPASADVTAQWFDSTALVRWKPVTDATGYRVTLIRLADMGIMQQKQVPATQLAFDAQGIWPGKRYQIAVQAVLANGSLGRAAISAPGQAQPISRATYNGFLDTMSLPAGQIDTNLWDVHIFYSNKPFLGATFVNDQTHGHIMAGCPSGTDCNGQQSITVQNARVPFDFSGGRTLTVHGEVDLKGDFHQWFGASLTPQIIGPDRVLDQVDRFYMPVTMPQLEVFSFEGHTNLLYAIGDGSMPMMLASVPNPTGINNVRDEIIWTITSSRVRVNINGQPAIDAVLPGGALRFTQGYLSLFAEDYPNSGGTNGQPACDQPGEACSIWHLDNWGFDAPTGQQQPYSQAYYADGCAPLNSSEGHEVAAPKCGDVHTAGRGTTVSQQVQVSSVDQVRSVRVTFDAQRLHSSGALKVRLNGGSWQDVPYIASDRNTYDYQSYTVAVDQAVLHAGENTVEYQQTSDNGGDAPTLANTQIEVVTSTGYVPPQLPPEPAPIGAWH